MNPKNSLEQAVTRTVEQLTKRKWQEKDARGLVDTIVQDALKKRLRWDRNVAQTLEARIAALDSLISGQLAEVMHDARFLRLEGTWRGLHHLIQKSELGSDTNIYVEFLNTTKDELHRDLTKSPALNQSELYKKVYYNQYDMGGGKPFGALIGDYFFDNTQDDLQVLDKMGQLGDRAFAPFIAAADPGLLGLERYSDIPTPSDIKEGFNGSGHVAWRALREKKHSRFVGLTLPRVLARLPYGSATHGMKQDGFNYEEVATAGDTNTEIVPNEHYCWMNAAYAYAVCLTKAFEETGWYSRIRGEDSGGRVEDLPTHTFIGKDGAETQNCPTEVNIWHERDRELTQAGFIPLCHHKGKDFAVFYSAQSVQRPAVYLEKDTTAAANLSARLPYVFATSRIAHYLKVLAHRWVGDYREGPDLERELQRWIMQYVSPDPNADALTRMQKPLRDAMIKVVPDPENPGVYNMEALLRPWYQLEELTASLQMVARIPKRGG